MEYAGLRRQISEMVLEALEKNGVQLQDFRYVPVGVTARHVHVTREHMDALFGRGVELTAFRPITQPGQYAAHEMVTVAGPKGKIENVRILGPFRKQTQMEASASDLRKLGIDAPIRESGKLAGSAGLTIVGPKGQITIPEGLIMMERHIHMTPQDIIRYGVTNGQKVMIRFGGRRGGILDNVFIRVRDDFLLDTHIDTDDASALGVSSGDMVEIIK